MTPHFLTSPLSPPVALKSNCHLNAGNPISLTGPPPKQASLPHASLLYLLILFVNIAIRAFVWVILHYHRIFVVRDAKWLLKNTDLYSSYCLVSFTLILLPCDPCFVRILISPPVISALVTPHSLHFPDNSTSPYLSLFKPPGMSA